MKTSNLNKAHMLSFLLTTGPVWAGVELAVWYPGGPPQGCVEGGGAGSNHSGYTSLPALPRPALLTFHQRNQFLKCAQL